jgi:hypothetical protein
LAACYEGDSVSDVDPQPTKETLRVPIVSAGQLVIMTSATFDAIIRTLEGHAEVSIEHPEKAQQAEFNRALQLASKADPDGKVHDLLQATLEPES